MRFFFYYIHSTLTRSFCFFFISFLSSINARSRYICSIFFAHCFAFVMYWLFSGCSLVACICVYAISGFLCFFMCVTCLFSFLSIVYMYIHMPMWVNQDMSPGSHDMYVMYNYWCKIGLSI